MVSWWTNIRWWIFPVILLVVLFCAFDSTIIDRPPGGTHFNRQTDVLAFVAHYRLTDAAWYEPGILHLRTQDAKAICEWPMLYYIVAKITTNSEQAAFLIRFIVVLSLLSALIRLHLVLRRAMVPFSEWILALLLTSGVLWYYAFNVLPEVLSLSFCLWGISYIIEAYFKGDASRSALSLMTVFFTCASLMKITYSLYPLCALGAALWGYKQLKDRQWFKPLIGFGFVHLLLVVVWYGYAKWYAVNSGDTYFLLEARPLWTAPQHEWIELLKWPWMVWGNFFLHWQVKSVLLIAAAYGLWHNRNSFPGVRPFLVMTTLSIIAFLVLFAVHLKDHDYYLLLMLPFFLLVLTWSFHTLPKTGWKQWYIAGTLAATVAIAGVYGVKKVNGRIKNRYSMFTVMYDAIKLDAALLASHSEHEFNRSILIGDMSYNGGLLALDKFGWAISFSDWNRLSSAYQDLYDQPQYLIFLKRDRSSTDFIPPGFEKLDWPTQAIEVWKKTKQ